MQLLMGGMASVFSVDRAGGRCSQGSRVQVALQKARILPVFCKSGAGEIPEVRRNDDNS